MAKEPDPDSFTEILKTLCELHAKLYQRFVWAGDVDAKYKADQLTFDQLQKKLEKGEMGPALGKILYRPVGLYRCQFYTKGPA